jgi:TonB family protein
MICKTRKRSQALTHAALMFAVFSYSGAAQRVPPNSTVKNSTASDGVIEPIDISKNPYRLRGHSGILDTRRVPLLVGDGTIQYAPYPGGNLRFSKMISERTAAYQVLVGREDVYPDGEILVELPDSTPPDSNKLWRVTVIGPSEAVNGLGNTIVVCKVKFLSYYEPPPQPAPPPSVPDASGTYKAGGPVSAPVLISSVEPEFPDAGRKANLDGRVVVSLIVDVTGRPNSVHVDKPIGHGFDEAAVAAVAQYKFKPAFNNGVAVPVRLTVEVYFQNFKN